MTNAVQTLEAEKQAVKDVVILASPANFATTSCWIRQTNINLQSLLVQIILASASERMDQPTKQPMTLQISATCCRKIFLDREEHDQKKDRKTSSAIVGASYAKVLRDEFVQCLKNQGLVSKKNVLTKLFSIYFTSLKLCHDRTLLYIREGNRARKVHFRFLIYPAMNFFQLIFGLVSVSLNSSLIRMRQS